jgi:uncharacterized membrane protein
MEIIEGGIEVDVPASTAYNVWTQFERFPEFMEDVTEVQQKDDRHLYWRANFWGKSEGWNAEITEQIPDKRIAWSSEEGARNAGVVTFHRLSDDRSRVMLQLGYEPVGLTERVVDALGMLTRRVERNLRGFKEFVEKQGEGIEGWRGEIPAKEDAAQKGD